MKRKAGRIDVLTTLEMVRLINSEDKKVALAVEAVEGAEDKAELGEQDLKDIGFCGRDVLVGIAASGGHHRFYPYEKCNCAKNGIEYALNLCHD